MTATDLIAFLATLPADCRVKGVFEPQNSQEGPLVHTDADDMARMNVQPDRYHRAITQNVVVILGYGVTCDGIELMAGFREADVPPGHRTAANGWPS